ncbi:MAG: flavodoxin [Bacteroides sp.]|nr:flavodoxin [Bacteroides sp.]
MKTKILMFLMTTLFAANSTSMFAQTGNEKKVLIAYYSLRNGNTRVVAQHIQKTVGGDIFRIETVDAYPAVYNNVTAQAKKELESGHRPALKTTVPHFDEYDIIYLGSPNWWNTLAPAVMTFLETYNFEGKTIVPFITHEGSRLGASVTDMEKLAPKATVLKGLPVRGGSVDSALPDVQKWLKEIGMTK